MGALTARRTRPPASSRHDGPHDRDTRSRSPARSDPGEVGRVRVRDRSARPPGRGAGAPGGALVAALRRVAGGRHDRRRAPRRRPRRRPARRGRSPSCARRCSTTRSLFFRDQPLTAAQHVAFARRFGELEVHPFIPANDELPELVRFAKSADVGGYENGWHSDVTWRAEPSMGAVLHAVAVPPSGGDTLFADMYAAYDGLDDDTDAPASTVSSRCTTTSRRSGTRCRPSSATRCGRSTRRSSTRWCARTPRPGASCSTSTGSSPATSSASRRDESRALIEELCRQAEIIEYQCRFRWAPDSVVIWDNRAVQHYASSDYWPVGPGHGARQHHRRRAVLSADVQTRRASSSSGFGHRTSETQPKRSNQRINQADVSS